MKKYVSMLKYIIASGISVSLFSCTKMKDSVLPDDTEYNYLPLTVYDSISGNNRNPRYEFAYDEQNRVEKSSIYITDEVTKTLFTKHNVFWNYTHGVICKADSAHYLPLDKTVFLGYDSIYLNNNNTIQKISSSAVYQYSLHQPVEHYVYNQYIFTYQELPDSTIIKVRRHDAGNSYHNSFIAFNKALDKISMIGLSRMDSVIAQKGKFAANDIYALFNIPTQVVPHCLPAKIINTYTSDIEIIKWEFDQLKRPVKAMVYSKNQNSLIRVFRFSY